MDIVIITLVILLSVWYVVRRFRATLKEKENPCQGCDGITCKQSTKQDCHDKKDDNA